ncbi:MAG: hypothetical protein ACP5NV_00895 [Candidatus Woesearchaeota archaeon]
MGDDDSDYELMPRKEIEQLRKEIASLRKNPYGESDKGKDLQQSIDRLNNTINKLLSILEDAQEDIIDEYQESKPVEKLNQILDQNETIAKALVSIHDKLSSKDSDSRDDGLPIPRKFETSKPQVQERAFQTQFEQPLPQMPSFNQSFAPQQPMQFTPPQQFAPQSPPQLNVPVQKPQFAQQPQFNQPQFSAQQFNQQFQTSPMNRMQDSDMAPLPPLETLADLPPLEGVGNSQMEMLPDKKKKFLGLI